MSTKAAAAAAAAGGSSEPGVSKVVSKPKLGLPQAKAPKERGSGGKAQPSSPRTAGGEGSNEHRGDDGTGGHFRRTGIPRNVNTYSHFLKHEYITEQDIEWVLKLRNADDTLKQRLAHIPNAPFNVSDKRIETMKHSHSVKDVGLKRGNVGNVEHLIRHRLGPTPTLGTVQFETGLRDYISKDEKLAAMEKGWSTIPKKERNEFPKFLPKLKEELAMRKTFKKTGKEENLYHDGFDRYLSLPKYSEQFRDKNVANNLHLFRPDAFSSTIKWETSLR